MSDLTFFEKQKFEKVLGMGSGYVLSFSDRTFAQFVLESTGLDIEEDEYHVNGRSKAKRLRTFWQIQPNAVVGKLLCDLLNYSEDKGAQAQICRLIAGRLLAGEPATKRQNASAPTPQTQPIGHAQHDRFATLLRDLMKLQPHPRGFAFEKFLDEVFATFDLAPRRSFRLVGEQIDGSFHLANETYLVEAKWQDQQIGNRELQSFAGAVRTKSAWARGLYVSYSGFTEDGLIAFGRGDATRIICIDGFELWQIFNRNLSLTDVLTLKTRRAAETGRAYFPVRELYEL
ncbi:restriction endonuclease [Paludibaculum fermentans]|uniref:Restriction endonuclease n=1 Tax=Paludibaculum fermentans TaxID=1473598 RepID=A0A7S7SNF5_PALFE|nr:restriction endonuclease [Paludibaculum fermentans]QOY90070.1 restriction endonuclease [Paludibaculum fermentans]